MRNLIKGMAVVVLAATTATTAMTATNSPTPASKPVASNPASAINAIIARGAGPDEPVACHIEVERGFGGISLVATAGAAARQPTATDWVFTVAGSGRSGTSRSTQSGTAFLSRGRTQFLGEVVLGSGGRFDATLQLSSREGNARCRVKGP